MLDFSIDSNEYNLHDYLKYKKKISSDEHLTQINKPIIIKPNTLESKNESKNESKTLNLSTLDLAYTDNIINNQTGFSVWFFTVR